jgi:hypothetical protein
LAYTRENLEISLQLVSVKIHIIPCIGFGEDGKKPCIPWKEGGSTDPSDVRKWYLRWPHCVPAILMRQNKWFGIDLDGAASVVWARDNVGCDIDNVPGSDSPRGGRHLYYLNLPGPDELGDGKLPRGLGDHKGKGYLIAPGARFADERYYSPRGNIFDRALLPVPPEWIALIKQPTEDIRVHEYVSAELITEAGKAAYGQKALARMVRDISSLAPDSHVRNNTLNTEAFRCAAFIRDGYLTQAEVYNALTLAALGCGLPRREIEATLASALGAGAGKAGPVRPKPRQGEDGGGPLPFDPAELVANVRARTGGQGGKEALITATPFVLRDGSLIPRRQWLYGTQLIRQFCSATVAHGAVGKSNLLIVEALAMVTGRNLLGVWPQGKLRVWYWNGEDPYEEIERRITAAAQHFRITIDDIGGRLFVNSGREDNSKIVIAEMGRFKVVIAHPVIGALKATIQANAIDVVMIDPFISSHKVSENDNNAIDAVAKTWGEIAEITNIGIDLAHHSKKTGGEEVTVEDSRGASALLAAVRSARALNTMTAEEAGKAGVPQVLRKRYFRVTDGKLNLAPPPEQDDWCHTVSVDLGNGEPFSVRGRPVCRLGGDSVGVVTEWQWPDAMDGITDQDFARAAEVIRSGKWREDIRAKGWVGEAVARALGLDLAKAADKAKVKGVIKAWLAGGRLAVVEGKDEKRQKKDFVEVAEAQPEEGCAANPEKGEEEEEE